MWVYGGGLKGHEASVVATNGNSPTPHSHRARSAWVDSRSSTCPHAKRRWNGVPGSPSPPLCTKGPEATVRPDRLIEDDPQRKSRSARRRQIRTSQGRPPIRWLRWNFADEDHRGSVVSRDDWRPILWGPWIACVQHERDAGVIVLAPSKCSRYRSLRRAFCQRIGSDLAELGFRRIRGRMAPSRDKHLGAVTQDHPPDLFKFAVQAYATAAGFAKENSYLDCPSRPGGGKCDRRPAWAFRQRGEDWREGRVGDRQPQDECPPVWEAVGGAPPRKHPVRAGRDARVRRGCRPCHPCDARPVQAEFEIAHDFSTREIKITGLLGSNDAPG